MEIGSHKTRITFRVKLAIILVLALINFTCCKKPYHEEFRNVQSWYISYEDALRYPQHQKGDAKEGNFFARATNKQNWTDFFICELPDSLSGKTLRVYIDCFVRKSRHGDGQGIIVQFFKNNALFYWQEFKIDDYTNSTNRWEQLCDSGHVQVPNSSTEYEKISMCIAGWDNANYPSFADVDDLKIQLKIVEVLKDKE